jgi:copper transport protein
MNREWPGRALAGLALLALALFLLWSAVPAQAHAAFERAEPAPNSVLPQHIHTITIWFSEPLEPEFSEIQVFNTMGERVDDGNTQVLPNDPMAMSVTLPTLPDGTYTVAWRNVSTVDGHPLRGSYVISFGQPITGTAAEGAATAIRNRTPLEPLSRAAVLIGVLTIAGAFIFERFLLRPTFFRGERSDERRVVGAVLVQRSRRLAWLAFLLLMGGSVGQLWAQAATVYEVDVAAVTWANVESLLRLTEWGNLWLLRLWLMLGVLAGLALTMLLTFPEDELAWETDEEAEAEGEDEAEVMAEPASGTPLGQIVAFGAALGVMLTITLSSHGAATAEIREAAIFSDYLHLLASAVWVGGLFHFALGVRPIYHVLPREELKPLLAQLVPRFSVLAMLSVGTLVITGLFASWAQVNSVQALVTPYGLTLLAKLALFLPMLALGAINLFWTSPRLREENRASWWLRRAVSFEALFGLLVLLSVGLLTSLEPARQVASRQGLGQGQELVFEETVERTNMTLTVEPALAGNNRFVVELRDPQGRLIDNASLVTLELSYLDADLGVQTVEAQRQESGQYVADEVLLSVAGGWQVGMLVTRPDAFDARAAFRFDVGSGTGGTLTQQAGYVLWGIELVLLGFLFLAIAIPLRRRRSEGRTALSIPGAVALFAGLLLVVGSPFLVQEAEGGQVNPIAPSAESVAMGEEIYLNNCQTCHGPTGLGDGPGGAGLNPPPANLIQHVPLHPDWDLFDIIENGIPDTAMPAFGGTLTEEEIWHLINYLRTLGEGGQAPGG